MTDTFNEVLLQAFSIAHPKTAPAYARAKPPGKNQPDFGNWINNPALASVLPKGISWFKAVHGSRVRADLAHAKSIRGVPTKPVSFGQREKLGKGAQVPWAELIIGWSKII
jgi:hypothetical protein